MAFTKCQIGNGGNLMEMDVKFEQKFAKYIDDAIHDNISAVIYCIMREAYKAGYRAGTEKNGEVTQNEKARR